ncbi:MAG: co-chaperone GroES [Pseudomonadota bacterium]
MSTVKFKPLQDRVLVQRLEHEAKSPGGIVIPDSAKEKPIEGVVVATGPGKSLDNGETRALAIKQGDKVLFGKYSGTEVKLDGEEYIVMREDDILGIVA